MDGIWCPPLPPLYEQLDTAHALLVIIISLLIYLLLGCLFLFVCLFSVLVLLCCVCGGLNGININKIELSSHSFTIRHPVV